MLRVLIAADHPIVRAGLKHILEVTPDIVVVEETRTGPETIQKAGQNSLDLILLDTSLPGMDGIDVLKELKRRRPKLPVIILTFHPETDYAVRALRAGASGYVVNDAPPDQFVEGLRRVAGGGRYITHTVAEQLAYLLSSPQRPHDHLSDREYRVMCLICSGKTISEMAEDLRLSPKTISTYRSRVLEKMRMRTNAELTHYVIQHGLVG